MPYAVDDVYTSLVEGVIARGSANDLSRTASTVASIAYPIRRPHELSELLFRHRAC